jgi:hypothetical protein
LIRRLPSRISKRMRLPSRGGAVFDVLLIMNAFHHSRSIAPAPALSSPGWFVAVPVISKRIRLPFQGGRAGDAVHLKSVMGVTPL